MTADPAWMVGFAQHLEACGFESIVVAEHTVLAVRYDSVYPYDSSGRVDLAADCPVPDPLELLAFLAGHTERLGLATGYWCCPTTIRSCWPNERPRSMRSQVVGFGCASAWGGCAKRSRRAGQRSPPGAAGR
ncbi:luciferase-like monooxygenase family protein [Mycobacterium xenopi 3993]|nr:luciferase-like monooxygenase family protein [Mycobacterium xenopi 3993]